MAKWKKYLLVFVSCWVIGFTIGFFIGERNSFPMNTELAFNKYLSSHYEESFEVVQSVNNRGIGRPVYTLQFCDQKYHYIAGSDSIEVIKVNYEPAQFSLGVVSASAVTGVLTSLGIKLMSAREIYAIAKTDRRIAVAATLGIVTGLGVGLYACQGNPCEARDTDFEMAKKYCSDPYNWSALPAE